MVLQQTSEVYTCIIVPVTEYRSSIWYGMVAS